MTKRKLEEIHAMCDDTAVILAGILRRGRS